MATVDFSFGSYEKPAQLSGSSLPPSVDVPLFRFRLRQLLLAFVAISAVFAAIALSHGMAGPAILLGIVVIFMHVFATSLGTKLRDQSDDQHAFEAVNQMPARAIGSAPERSARLLAIRSQARSPWHARGATALPWLRALVIGAFAAGALTGSSYLAATVGYRTSPAGIVVGGISVAVLFGWFAFLFGSFYGVFRHGFREAAAEQARESI
jgi:hypothetical protein